MGRKKTKNAKKKLFSLSAEAVKRVEHLAKSFKGNQSEFIEQLIIGYIRSDMDIELEIKAVEAEKEQYLLKLSLLDAKLRGLRERLDLQRTIQEQNSSKRVEWVSKIRDYIVRGCSVDVIERAARAGEFETGFKWIDLISEAKNVNS